MDETYKTFHRVLACGGVSIFATNNWDSKLWLTHQISNFIIAILCFIFTTGFLVFEFSDFVLWLQGACVWTTGVIMTIIFGVLLKFRYKFRRFLEEMIFKDAMTEMPLVQFVFQNSQSTPKLEELRLLVINSQEKLFKYIRIFLKTFITCIALCVTLYVCNPIYQMITREDKSSRILVFEMWIPWSLQDMNVYILTLIFNIYCGYMCCIAYSGFQSTIIFLVGQVVRQLRIIAFILLHLNDLVLEITKIQDDRWQYYCTNVLSQCIEHYVKIKRFSNRLNVISRPFYLAIILVGIMLVCVCSVKIATSNKLSLDTMKFYLHEFCFIIVVLCFCLLGQQVENECEILENVVTEKWYIYNKSHKKNVLIFKMALDQRMPIYIFGTIPLSLTTFTWFIKTGMSFFTLVMNVMEEQEGNN